MRTHLIVGIAGGSGAGKHRVIQNHLLPSLNGNALILEHDWYYHGLEYLFDAQGVSRREDINYDHPDAYENTLLATHLRMLRAGRAVEVFPYRKGHGTRSDVPFRLEPREIVILDGMMIFAVPELVEQLSITAYVHAEEPLRLQRRILRDLEFSPEDESVLRFYRDVLPAHHRYVEPHRDSAHFVLHNTRDGDAPGGVDAFLHEVRCRREQIHGEPGYRKASFVGMEAPAR